MLCTRVARVGGHGLVTGLRCCGITQRRSFFNLFGEQVEKSHYERKILPFSQEKMFEVVADVDRYKEFLPWCKESIVKSKTDNVLVADLTIGFQVFEEKYTSKVILDNPKSVKVTVEDSPLFHYLINTWEFLPGSTPNTCVTDFKIVFKLKSQLHTKLIEPVFEKATHALVSAFEARARDLQNAKKALSRK